MVNPIKSYSFRALAVLRGVDDDDDDDDYVMWRRITCVPRIPFPMANTR